MKSIILSDSCFSTPQIYSLSAKYNAEIVNLDNINKSSKSDVFNTYDSWDIWIKAYQLAQTWYLLNGEDITLYKGISIGKIIEIEMWYFWRHLFERIEILDRVLKTINPSDIYLATCENDQIRSVLLDFMQFNAQVKTIRPTYGQQLFHFRKPEKLRDLLKDSHIDRYFRLLSLFGSRLHRRHQFTVKKKTTIDVLAILEQPGAYLADSILPVLDFFPQSSVLLLDPRHFERALRIEREIIYQTDAMFKETKIYWHVHRMFAERWNDTQKKLSDTLEYEQKKLWPIAATRLKSVFKRLFPIVAVEIVHARKLLLERKVKSLLMSTDAHHGGRLFTLVANELNVPSLVVQHGATIGDWGYVPLYATRFAAWGEISARWMIAKGTLPEKVVVTGQPRFDHFANNNSNLTRTSYSKTSDLSSESFWLLWAMDPITKIENAEILDILLEVVSILPWCSLIIRPHPGIPQIEWLVEMVKANDVDRIFISSTQEPLHDVLRIIDSIIIQDSTVGIEAMALNKPIIVLKQKEEGYLKGVNSGQIANHAQNAHELQRILSDLYQFQQFGGEHPLAQAQQEFIRRYMFKLDGNSAQRIAATLSTLIQSSNENYV